MLLEALTSGKKGPHRYRGISQDQPHSFFCERPDAKERLGSERDGVIVAGKRQWPDAGISLGTGGGLFFLTSKLLEAFF